MTKNFSVNLSDEFVQKLEEMEVFYEKDVKYFQKLVYNLFDKFDLLKNNPAMYPVYDGIIRKMVLPDYGLIVYYAMIEEKKEVLIITLQSQKQKTKYFNQESFK